MSRQSETQNVKKLCACARGRWSSCAHPWYVDYKAPKWHPRRPNQRYRKNLDVVSGRHAVGLREAQDEARRAITAWLDGRDARLIQRSDRPTLAQYLEQYVARPNAPENDAQQVTRVIATVVLGRPFGQWRLEEITREAIDVFRNQRPKVAGNRNLALLRAMFNRAVIDGIVRETPFKVGSVSVVRLAREESRSRRLQGGEELKLLAACNPGVDKRGRPWRGNPHLLALVIGALETGMRRGELLSLQWSQVGVDLFLPAGKTKARRARRVPISSRLRTVLEARKNDPAGEPLPPGGHVFGDEMGRPHGAIKTAWRLLCSRAGIDDLHFHDLRREAGSRWMDAGVPLATIQRWLGHANISQTSKYLAATLGRDVDEMRAYEERIGRVQSEAQVVTDSAAPRAADSTGCEPAKVH